jgi:hypothetical protein
MRSVPDVCGGLIRPGGVLNQIAARLEADLGRRTQEACSAGRAAALLQDRTSAQVISILRRRATTKALVVSFASAIAQALGECLARVIAANSPGIVPLDTSHLENGSLRAANGGQKNTDGTHRSKFDLREKAPACGKSSKRGKKHQPAGKVTKIASLEGKSTNLRAREKAPTYGKSSKRGKKHQPAEGKSTNLRTGKKHQTYRPGAVVPVGVVGCGQPLSLAHARTRRARARTREAVSSGSLVLPRLGEGIER